MIQPERTVHAKGAGGCVLYHWQACPTHGNSTIASNLGNPDAVRDLRGLAFK